MGLGPGWISSPMPWWAAFCNSQVAFPGKIPVPWQQERGFRFWDQEVLVAHPLARRWYPRRILRYPWGDSTDRGCSMGGWTFRFWGMFLPSRSLNIHIIHKSPMLGQILIDFMAMDSYGPTKRANSGVQPGIVWDTLGIIGTRILLVTGGYIICRSVQWWEASPLRWCRAWFWFIWIGSGGYTWKDC